MSFKKTLIIYNYIIFYIIYIIKGYILFPLVINLVDKIIYILLEIM